jgi:Tfp pilus assembly protein PilV
MLSAPTKRRSRERGFSILEMMLATVIMLVGIVAVAQLVPASILLNFRNRTDSSAMVFAQRELDQMLDQPLSATSFTDAALNVCNLGDPAQPNQLVGSSITTYNGQALIDFNAALQPGYNFAYQDPTDPSRVTYDVRWAVIITGGGSSTTVFSKRIIIGVRQQGGSGYFQPIALDTMVQK